MIQWFYQSSLSSPQRQVGKPNQPIVPSRTGIYTCVANNTNNSRDSAQVRVQKASKPKSCHGKHAVPDALNLLLINSRLTSLDKFVYDTVLSKNDNNSTMINSELDTAHCVSINKHGEYKMDQTDSKKQFLISEELFNKKMDKSLETSFEKFEKLLPPVLKMQNEKVDLNELIDCQLNNEDQVFKTNRLSFSWKFTLDSGKTWTSVNSKHRYFQLSALINENTGQKLGERLKLENEFKTKVRRSQGEAIFISCKVRKLPDFSDEGPHLSASQRTQIGK